MDYHKCRLPIPSQDKVRDALKKLMEDREKDEEEREKAVQELGEEAAAIAAAAAAAPKEKEQKEGTLASSTPQCMVTATGFLSFHLSFLPPPPPPPPPPPLFSQCVWMC